MAIEKIKTKQVEWTPAALVQLSVAGVLVLLSLFMLYVAVRKFGLKVTFGSAVAYYDSNRPNNAGPSLESALSWDGDHHYARELQAKIAADGGDAATAEREYTALLAAEPFRKETAHYGLGVLSLRKADAAKDAKAFDAALKGAQAQFKNAKAANPQMVEAEIGLRHCDLLSLQRAGATPEKAKPILVAFEKVLQQLTANAQLAGTVSKEGLVDLYAGLGWSHAVAGNQPESARFFRACHQLAPRWPLPKKNLVYVEARRRADTDVSLEELKRQEQSINLFRSEIGSLILRQKDHYRGLDEALLQYLLAVAYSYARAGDMGSFGRYMHELMTHQQWGLRLEPHLMDLAVASQIAIAPNPDSRTRDPNINNLATKLQPFLRLEMVNKPENAPVRAAALNNLGFVQEHQAAGIRGEEQFDRAIALFKDSLKLEDSYEASRNIAVIQRRRGGRQAEAQEHFDRAVKAAEKRSEDWVKKDVAALTKFMTEGGP